MLEGARYRLQQTATEQISLAPAGSYGGGALLLNSSVFMQALDAPARPLLVRFDWYSRKNTPVHIGYVLLECGCIIFWLM